MNLDMVHLTPSEINPIQFSASPLALPWFKFPSFSLRVTVGASVPASLIFDLISLHPSCTLVQGHHSKTQRSEKVLYHPQHEARTQAGL